MPSPIPAPSLAPAPPRPAAAGAASSAAYRRARGAAALGRRGEELAAAWYAGRGFELLVTNWRCPAGELDVVARRGRLLVVCEVKARSGSGYGQPEEAVGAAKRLRLRRTTARFLSERRPGTGSVRFDVACLGDGELRVIEGAFD